MIFLDKINSPSDLKQLNVTSMEYLCGEIRQFLLESIAVTGGHLASNLGVVELTVALHYCFNSPIDKIIWDVGHQAYVHKILTGRREQFDTLRKHGGLSGFPKSIESPHDAFDTGHSATSISAALGMALSRDLAGDDYNVVAVIGDGSMTGGLAYEALNNAGRLNTNLIVVLNDNQMSISENVGAVSRHLNDIRTAPSYHNAKADVSKFLKTLPYFGDTVEKAVEKTKDLVRYLLVNGGIFEELGFTYVGPIDGHNLEELIEVLQSAKKLKKPILLHVHTTKGKGYEIAENSPAKFHGVESFNVETGVSIKAKTGDTYSDTFGKELVRLAKDNDKIVAITAAMQSGTGLTLFQNEFPERIFDVGIAESHAVTFAAGMAKNGFIPVFAVYSTFLQRGYDQIVHDVCLQNLHVVFAIDRAGIVGSDGETHQGIFDISFLSHIPNMTIMAPKNAIELEKMLEFAMVHNGPIAIRYPRGGSINELECAEISLGKSEIVLNGSRILIVTFGAMFDTSLEVCNALKTCDEIDATLVNARFAKPVDAEIVKMFALYERVYVIEDNLLSGGFGSKLLETAMTLKLATNHVKLFAFEDVFVEQGTREELFKDFGLDAQSIYEQIKSDITNDK